MRDALSLDPVKLLIDGQDPKLLLKFCQRLLEENAVAFADAVKAVPDVSRPSSKQARGSFRRDKLDEALRRAATACEVQIDTRWTVPKSWSYPVVQIGAFRLTVGVVDSAISGRGRRLRTVSRYVEDLCARNVPLNPQSSISFDEPDKVSKVWPAGTFGALLITEYNPFKPDVPALCGFWVPSESLKKPYYYCSVEKVMTSLRSAIEGQSKPERQTPKRKLPTLRQSTGSEE